MNKILRFYKNISVKKIIYLMLIISTLFLIFVFIKKPHKLVSDELYDKNQNIIIKKVSFPIQQKIKLKQNLINLITIYFDDDSINNYDYNIKIYNENEEILFEQKYKDYESNLVLIDTRNLKKNINYKLEIDCESCGDVKIAIGKSINKNNRIETSKNESLKIKVDYYEDNNIYYIIPIIIIVLSIIILLSIKLNLFDNIIQKLFKNCNIRVIILYIIILLSIGLIILIYLLNPKSINHNSTFRKNNTIEKKEVNFPIVQNIKLKEENLKIITLYFDDDSINAYPYTINVYDEDNNLLFNHDYIEYNSNIVLIDSGPINYNKKYKVVIDCDECRNVKMAVGKSINNKNKIEKTKNDSLKITIDNYKKNNNYYWYPLIIIAVCLTLLPLARSTKNGKK